jgi:hypothetical protein
VRVRCSKLTGAADVVSPPPWDEHAAKGERKNSGDCGTHAKLAMWNMAFGEPVILTADYLSPAESEECQ